MSTVLAQIFDPHFIGTILRVATPLLLAALGVMISDRAGVLNIGMEGMMLVAALIAVLASAATGSPAIGLWPHLSSARFWACSCRFRSTGLAPTSS